MRPEVAACLLGSVATAGEATFEARFRFGPELEVFAGHFPGHPLVPGVFLLEATRLTCERALGHPVRIALVRRAKFAAEVRPDEEVVVRASLTPGTAAGWSCRARLAVGEREVALLRLELARA